jgi:hypothetical protein
MRHLIVEILPNTNKKSKWYYGYINTNKGWAGRQINVEEHEFEFVYEDCYRYNDSFIDKKDCKIIKIL